MTYVFAPLPADRGRIDLDDPREVNWWRKRFDCSEQQLRRAVPEVGDWAAKVEQVLDGKDIMSVCSRGVRLSRSAHFPPIAIPLDPLRPDAPAVPRRPPPRS